jgi:beta propeller repeat protein
MWDRAGGERRFLGGGAGVWAVYEDKVAVAKHPGSEFDLWLYDPIHGERLISAAPGDQIEADVFGDFVVWEDHRGPYSQIYMWDPVNGERRISPTNSNQARPKIWGDTVVYDDNRTGRTNVFRWNPREGDMLLSNYLNVGFAPAIYGDKVIMFWLNDWNTTEDAPGLWEWTPGGGLRRLLEFSPPLGTAYPNLVGDLVVWSNNNGAVFSWDPVHGRNEVTPIYGSMPSLYDNKVAWISGPEDIYLSTLVPEPSGFIVLAAAIPLLWAMRRRLRMG